SPSFIPPPAIRALRDLTRQRTGLIRDRVAVVDRVYKVLEDANIKPASVASDVLGVSGRARLGAIIAGCDDPGGLAELAKQRLRGKILELKQALRAQGLNRGLRPNLTSGALDLGQHVNFRTEELLQEVDSSVRIGRPFLATGTNSSREAARSHG